MRDFLLKRDTIDHDIATDALPEQVLELFPEAMPVGVAFGVVLLPSGIEIATFRRDLEYKDHRHPEGVEFASPEEDARRRDFTINGLFYDVKSEDILDCVGGLDDLKARVLRAIGDPKERFREDALRLLRAVRFATRLQFDIEPGTADAIRAQSRLISRVSAERIRDELDEILRGSHPRAGVELMHRLGILSHILPELERTRGVSQADPLRPDEDVWSFTLRVLDELAKPREPRSFALSLSALCGGLGKPAVFRNNNNQNFNGHEIEGAKLTSKIAERLKLPNSEIDRAAAIVGDQLKFREVFQMREATFLRWIAMPHFEDSLRLHRAEALAIDGNLTAWEYCARRLEELRNAPKTEKLVSGEDLVQLGLKPGPEVARILRAVEDLTLERKLQTKEAALEYVLRTFVR